MPELPDYAVLAQKHWTTSNAQYTDGRAREAWAQDEISWGVWKNRESDLLSFPT